MTTGRTAMVLCIAVTVGLPMIVGGCANRIAPPPPELGYVAIESLGGRYHVEAEGIDPYVNKFGDAGWIKGLSDARPVIQQTKEDVSHSIGAPSPSYDPRVKDVFYLCYVRKFPAEGAARGFLSKPVRERDSQIDTVIAAIKKRS